MTLSSSVFWVVTLLGQSQTAVPGKSAAPAARLDFMKESLASITLRPSGDRTPPFVLKPEPVLRFTNSVGLAIDGAIFLWLGEGERPAAAVQVFMLRTGEWLEEFSSLSTSPLSAGEVWDARRPGVEFKLVPGAPKPAATAELRLRQMRDLAGGFSAEDDFEQKSWQPLRLLTKPVARYGKAGTDVVDGALFAFVLTTDPEVYLMLEVRPGKGGPEWQYAFAPMTIYPVRAFWKGKEVWSLPYREAWTDRNAPFYARTFAQAQ